MRQVKDMKNPQELNKIIKLATGEDLNKTDLDRIWNEVLLFPSLFLPSAPFPSFALLCFAFLPFSHPFPFQ